MKKNIIFNSDAYELFSKEKDYMEEEGIDIDDNEVWERCYDSINIWFDDEKLNLNIETNGNIIAIANLVLWSGRTTGYKMLNNNISSIVDYFSNDDIIIFTDQYNVRATGFNHDGQNYIIFREIKSELSEKQIENFLDKIYNNTVTSKDISKYTRSILKKVNNVYGW